MSDKVTKLPVRLKDNSKLVALANPYGGCQHRRSIVDRKLAELTCADCGAKLNPIEYVAMLAGQENAWEWRTESLKQAAAKVEERKRCRCTKCGEITEIRRVSNREVTRLRSQANKSTEGT